MGKVIRLNESQLNNIIKNVIKEQQDDLELRSTTQLVNNKIGENLTPDEVAQAVCGGQNVELDLSQVPQESQDEAKKVFDQIKSKVATSSLGDLVKALRQMRQLKKQMKQQSNEQYGNEIGKVGTGLLAATAAGTAISILGIPVSVTIAAALTYGGGFLLIIYMIIKSIIGESRMPRVPCSAYGRGQYSTKTRGQMNKVRKGVGNVGMYRGR